MCVKSSPIYSIRLFGLVGGDVMLTVVPVEVPSCWRARGVLFDTPYVYGFSRWLQLVMLPDFGLVLKVVEVESS